MLHDYTGHNVQHTVNYEADEENEPNTKSIFWAQETFREMILEETSLKFMNFDAICDFNFTILVRFTIWSQFVFSTKAPSMVARIKCDERYRHSTSRALRFGT
mgnify:CR=1 FL=1